MTSEQQHSQLAGKLNERLSRWAWDNIPLTINQDEFWKAINELSVLEEIDSKTKMLYELKKNLESLPVVHIRGRGYFVHVTEISKLLSKIEEVRKREE